MPLLLQPHRFGGGLVPVGISTGQYIATLATQADMEDYLDACVSVGAKWIREAIVWSTIQPTNSSTFDWTRWDVFASLCAARNLKLCVNIGGSPAWARPTHSTAPETSPPDSPSTFATFCTACVTRYGSQVKHWECWNEPNQPSYWGGTASVQRNSSPTEYTAILSAMYGAIKAVDPTATILGGSFTPAPTGMGTEGQYYSPPDFLSGMLAAGAASVMDGVAHHPYSYPVNPTYAHAENAWWQMENTTPSLRSLMTSYGIGSMKIWVTEYGAPTYGVGAAGDSWVTEANQAAFIDEAIRICRANPHLYGACFIFTGADRAAAGVDTDREKHFGVMTPAPTFAHKPAGTAMLDAINDTGGVG